MAEEDRTLDIWILQKVFGVKKVFRPSDTPDANGHPGWSGDLSYIPSGKSPRTHMIDARPVPAFTKDMSAAWQAISALNKEGYFATLITPGHLTTGILYHCKMGHRDIGSVSRAAATMPMAICMAIQEMLSKPPNP